MNKKYYINYTYKRYALPTATDVVLLIKHSVSSGKYISLIEGE